MALFNRKKQDSVLPEEVQNYYKAEKRQRSGVAWLLALVTLAVTILLAAALFFGGRWLYRTIFDRNDNNTSSQQTEQGSSNGSSSESTSGSSSSDNQTGSGSSGSSGSSSSNASGSTGTSGGSTGSSSTPAPITPTENQLINTGPGDE